MLWTPSVGLGFGGPAVSDGKVYLLDRDDQVGDKLRVLDLSTGKELWSFAYDAPGTFMFAGSRTTPTVDGDHVYAVGPLGICTQSTRRLGNRSGTRTSGRSSAAVSCRGGRSPRTR